jgi:hypothetical protein
VYVLLKSCRRHTNVKYCVKPGGYTSSGTQSYKIGLRKPPVVRMLHSSINVVLLTLLWAGFRNIASLSAYTAAELRELLIPGGGREWWSSGRSSSSEDVAGLRDVCYHAKAAAFQVG